MNLDSIENRIDELNFRKMQLKKQIQDKQRELTEVRGALKEMWGWHDAWKATGQYGHLTQTGEVKVFKVPTFGNDMDIKRALEGNVVQEDGKLTDYTPEEVKEARQERGKKDAQQAVDIMDGQSPFEEDERDTEAFSDNSGAGSASGSS